MRTVFPDNDLFLNFYSDNKFDISRNFQKILLLFFQSDPVLTLKPVLPSGSHSVTANVAEAAKIQR